MERIEEELRIHKSGTPEVPERVWNLLSDLLFRIHELEREKGAKDNSRSLPDG